ncbi:HNH endonuclease [Natranaeroarchaeum sulfidigenes]|uniref:Restriction endonuclease, HNH family n=1 Tax=Natranaeroarchaeum sulfidigenes TaxID=2784880 RepID=A0A897MRC0_9EURY|nr:HNH endonuclease signature motif containing protein [Natranaeroarchaeum sulfidigenes]QSG01563.1 Restriction endonuclease, HNH family [Natranaeroarchaeum sulfidigenes]
MGVVRRENDWRLEKREDGLYEITYQKDLRMKILTPDYKQGMMDNPRLDAVPVREVGSYSEAEGLFEEMANGDAAPVSGPTIVGSTATGTESTLGGELDSGGFGSEEENNLPAGGLALVLIVAGVFVMRSAGFAPTSVVFLSGVVSAIIGVAIFAWAGLLYKKHGWSDALEFLITVDDDLTSSEETDKPEKTPPTPEKLKNRLIFDRAGQKCEWCEESFDHPHVHHIKPRREGGPNEPENLIVLCPNCHEKADREAIPRSKLKAKVKRLPSLSTQ